MSTTAISAIKKQLTTAFSGVRGFYLVLGQAALALREHGTTWPEIGTRVREWLPDAESVGMKLSDAFIKRAALSAEKLFAGGALVSPDGKHTVLPEDMADAGLTAKEVDRVADLIEASGSTTSGPKLRVNQVADLIKTMRGNGGNDTKAAAKLDFMRHVAEVEEHIVASTEGDELALARQAYQRELAKLDRMQTAILKQRAKVDEAKATLAALEPAPAPVTAKPKRARAPKHGAAIAAGAEA